MALVSEKRKGFRGLLSKEYGYSSQVLVQDFSLPFPSGHPMLQLTVNNENSWLVWFSGLAVIPGQMGISLNEGFQFPASNIALNEYGKQSVVTSGAEFAFEHLDFDWEFNSIQYIATPAEIEAIEDALRGQGVILRKNSHLLQN